MAKKITCFQSEDGKIFESESECDEHNKNLSFTAWYESERNTSLYGEGHMGLVDPDVLRSWLILNRDYVIDFLKDK